MLLLPSNSKKNGGINISNTGVGVAIRMPDSDQKDMGSNSFSAMKLSSLSQECGDGQTV